MTARNTGLSYSDFGDAGLVDRTGNHFSQKNWTDANAIWGYLNAPGTGTVQTARVGAREKANKQNKEVVIHP